MLGNAAVRDSIAAFAYGDVTGGIAFIPQPLIHPYNIGNIVPILHKGHIFHFSFSFPRKFLNFPLQLYKVFYSFIIAMQDIFSLTNLNKPFNTLFVRIFLQIRKSMIQLAYGL